ncbi:MAG: sulfite exporter TauE/SafE family protein [Candidatus Nanopelagicaceae bacterium]|jgi:uncharacterized protein|nr:sulfite exporter TauE/SafE family protein [Actinomycetota bacterium]NDI09539.1 sulfite exporter TauE/SafE family protein [Actinomycetota bacterium]
MEIVIALIAGLFIGLVLGFVGAGGAMLALPIMIYLLDFTALQATTAAMVVVGLAALAGARERFKKGEVLVREAITISSLGLATNVTFSSLAKEFSDSTITAGLAIVLAFAGWSMLLKPFKPGPERRMSTPILVLLALTIGAITGTFGIGGGFIAIPILVLFYNTPLAKASGTSLLIIFLNSSIAFLSRFQSWNEVDWHLPVLMAAMAIVISSMAARLKVSSDILKKSFALLLFAVALFTLLETFMISL